jgi:anti-sigma regulatory factor (Ser/Thr protein kinase)
MIVSELIAALRDLPQDLPIIIWDAGTRLGLAHVDDSFVEDDYPRVELNTDRDD